MFVPHVIDQNVFAPIPDDELSALGAYFYAAKLAGQIPPGVERATFEGFHRAKLGAFYAQADAPAVPS